ncbi:hypothetical protein DF186_18270, partial [Enterococcus hirae]
GAPWRSGGGAASESRPAGEFQDAEENRNAGSPARSAWAGVNDAERHTPEPACTARESPWLTPASFATQVAYTESHRKLTARARPAA